MIITLKFEEPEVEVKWVALTYWLWVGRQ